jgi:CelD/BcsL family acetyltransferase involved in cellulose biosynthesis
VSALTGKPIPIASGTDSTDARREPAKVEWLHDLTSDRLLQGIAESAGPDIFHTLRWFQHLHDHGMERGEGLLIARVTHPTEGGFVLPLQPCRGGKASAFGRSITGLSNYYSSLFGPIGDPAACTAAAARELAHSLRRDVAHSAVIDLHPLDAEGRFLHNLREGLSAEGYFVDTYFCFGNWYLPVEGRSWAEIEPGIPSRQRNTIKRARKKLAESGPWTLQIHQAPGLGLERAIADYQAIYLRSWKKPEPFPDFVPGLCRWTAERGWLRLGVVRVGVTPVAAQIWFVREGKALIFKLAYDEEFKRLSAGSVLTAELMRHMVDVDRADEVDYLTGDDAYKADWMTHRRERMGLVAFRVTRPVGFAAAVKHKLGLLRTRLRSNP